MGNTDLGDNLIIYIYIFLFFLSFSRRFYPKRLTNEDIIYNTTEMLCTCDYFSPGFSAKFNMYSLMDNTTDKIEHFELVQVNLNQVSLFKYDISLHPVCS